MMMTVKQQIFTFYEKYKLKFFFFFPLHLFFFCCSCTCHWPHATRYKTKQKTKERKTQGVVKEKKNLNSWEKQKNKRYKWVKCPPY
ncbi:hypothetical protein, unlikely [Trypanosoma brucei gambiense DAL972]|uniref:Uncharacterized protein n=1 Tax=Trypanosoma brucei gambiense (strain MHOM/CI/86/DAL972) TaxID=679716 RepID=C9ZM91_TRYB9|nr:hypothetical protein, unlikely [Trypanosoma brucei gambiense DAL972]CBH10764.1 hypothetical protein, unlikely [Trypanosoma brucei gambiense DAL972]|eukprot:XP_011773052.1 hypothetical protein, unlikely [Trypanosoma brucei gambiense DAL972]